MTIEDVKVKVLEYLEGAEKYGFAYGVGRNTLLDHYGIETKTKGIYIFNRAIYQMVRDGVIYVTNCGHYKINRAGR